ncbi:MAG: ATP synthase F1 subunit delta [Candidatus Kapabacteria bacterium]|nr:ATP synthase F1 subunit delta [Candidatus Kapabacteria bacterium]
MVEQKVSSRYAKALYGIAVQFDSVEKVYADMLNVQRTISSNSELLSFIKSPVINHRKKEAIFDEIFTNQIGETTLEFIKLLAHKQREWLILSIIRQFEIIYNRENNIVEATITTAREMDEATKANVLAALTKSTAKKIKPTFVINPSIKGGIMVRIADKVFDASISNKLENLRVRLKETLDVEIN